jgi:short-subunit dehydrogenase
VRLDSLAGRVAVVTGASSGIGRVLAMRLAAGGARVALVARRAEALAEVAAAIEARGGVARAVACDVGDRAAVEAAAARVEAELGPVELLVNNAGRGGHRPFLRWDVADVEALMRVNYLGAVYWTKAVLPGMVARGEGWLVFVASVAGHLPSPDESAYVASKFAMVGLSEVLSMELEGSGVHVLQVCPGVIRTPFFDAEALARMPAAARRQMREPEGLADAVLRALARGRHRLTYPAPLAAAYAIRQLLPRFFRWGTKKAALPDDAGAS